MINSNDIFIDFNIRVYRETRFGICLDINGKNSTLIPTKKSEMHTKGLPCALNF